MKTKHKAIGQQTHLENYECILNVTTQVAAESVFINP